MRNRVCALMLMALAGFPLAAAPAAGQAGRPATEVRADVSQLRDRAERRFQVVPLRRGLMLVPKSEAARVRSIEIDAGQVIVDGAAVTGRELRDRIGEDADIVAQLSFLDAATLRQLFAEPAAAPRALPPPAAVEPQAQPVLPTVPAVPTKPDDTGWSETSRYRHGGARFRVGGDVTVRAGEVISNDVVVVLGSARIEGRVDGEVVAIGGSVYLGPKADVLGTVTSIGGQVSRAEGSKVSGEINEVRVSAPDVGPIVHIRPWREWAWVANPFGASADLVGTIVRVGLLGLFAALLVAVVPGPVRRVADRVTTEPWRAGLVGLVAQLLFVPLLVLTVVILAVSIVGIPLLLLVPFVLITVIIGFLLGFAGTGCAVGEMIGRRSSGGVQSLLVSLVIGLALIFGLTVVARIAGLAGLPVRILLSVVLFAGFLIEYVAWTIGFGAVLLSRFGRRGGTSDGGFVPPVPGYGAGAPTSL